MGSVIMIDACLLLFYALSNLISAGSVDLDGSLRINKTGTTTTTSASFVLAGRNKIQSIFWNDISEIAGWNTEVGYYYGTRAKIGIWGSPYQGHSQESGAFITVFNGSEKVSFSTIEAGFHVSRTLYNNSDIRFYVLWTKDDYQSGYYNLRCPGFVPAGGAALVPGQAVSPPSTYGGKDRYITISLHTDPNSGDWVLYRDDLDTASLLGYFPKELIPTMSGGAPRVGWLGYVSYHKNEQGPPMGSGHFPTEGMGKAAYFKNIKLFNSKANAYGPSLTVFTPQVTKQDCYHFSEVKCVRKGCMFYYGGPSGCTGH